LESLYHLSRHEWPVHRWAHTFLAAGLIGAITGVVLAAVARSVTLSSSAPALKGETASRALVLGGFLGGVTHPLLGGLLATDIHPFQPLTTVNPLLGLVPVRALLGFCVLTGVLGAAILLKRDSVRNDAG